MLAQGDTLGEQEGFLYYRYASGARSAKVEYIIEDMIANPPPMHKKTEDNHIRRYGNTFGQKPWQHIVNSGFDNGNSHGICYSRGLTDNDRSGFGHGNTKNT
jgi:hypothetical protein